MDRGGGWRGHQRDRFDHRQVGVADYPRRVPSADAEFVGGTAPFGGSDAASRSEASIFSFCFFTFCLVANKIELENRDSHYVLYYERLRNQLKLDQIASLLEYELMQWVCDGAEL